MKAIGTQPIAGQSGEEMRAQITDPQKGHLRIAERDLREAIEQKGLGKVENCRQLLDNAFHRLKLAGIYPEECNRLLAQARTDIVHSMEVANARRTLSEFLHRVK